MTKTRHTKRSVKDIRFFDVVKWLKTNAIYGDYIAHNMYGQPIIDVKLLCKDMKRELTNKQQDYDKGTRKKITPRTKKGL